MASGRWELCMCLECKSFYTIDPLVSELILESPWKWVKNTDDSPYPVDLPPGREQEMQSSASHTTWDGRTSFSISILSQSILL